MFLIFPSAFAFVAKVFPLVERGTLRISGLCRVQNTDEALRKIRTTPRAVQDRIFVIFGQEDLESFSVITKTLGQVSEEIWYIYYGDMPRGGLPEGIHAVLPASLKDDLVGTIIFFACSRKAESPDVFRRFSTSASPPQKTPTYPRPGLPRKLRFK